MLAENSFPRYSGVLDKELHLPATSKYELTSFIANQIVDWRNNPDRPDRDGETILTEHLCSYLNSAVYYSEAWSHIQFQPETSDETNVGRKIDLTAKPRAAKIIIEGRRHTQFDSLFPIECKRLPTPKQKNRDDREYVVTRNGTTGGIQRFKYGHHGASHKFAAMIAYIQDRDAQHWKAAVNSWIDDLAKEQNTVWSNSDHLAEINLEVNSDVSCLQSIHNRTDGLDDVEIRHLWIQMN